MKIEIRTGERPALRRSVRRGKFDAAYAAAHTLLPGQWFVLPEGRVKCLSVYRKELARRGVKNVDIRATVDDQVVFVHKDDPTAPTAAPSPALSAGTAEPVKRGPGRPPGSGKLKPPPVDPQVARLARR